MEPMKLGYWKIRGLAQPIRLLLGYTDTEFVDVLYECGDGPNYDRSCWLNVKENLGLDFPNLPYLIDGDNGIVQSNSIMRYIGKKNKLDGDSTEEQKRVEIMENVAMDFRNDFFDLSYRTKKETLKDNSAAFLNTVHKKFLVRFEKYLNDKKYFAGNKVTYVDFIMYELLLHHLVFDAKILDVYPNLKEFIKRFEAIPKVSEFMRSDKCFHGPINNKMALVNGIL